MKYVFGVLGVLCLATSINAQPVFCVSNVLPDQGGLLDTSVTVPPGAAGIYPIVVNWPEGGQRVSVIKWASWFPPGYPAGTIRFREYVDTLPYPAGAAHNAQVVGILENTPEGGATTFAESTPVLANEQYIVWIGNTNAEPVTVHLAVHVQTCAFATM